MTSIPILDQIIAHKREEIRALQSQREVIRAQAARAGRPRVSFRAALQGRDTLSVIAEIKRASPSEGVLLGDKDPLGLLKAYERGGASAISVVTDERFFQGSLELLSQVAGATELPVLRKEFIIDPVQIEEARGAGAAAVLLLASVLSEDELRSFREVAERLGMDVLVEVHHEAELETTLRSGATLIGVNNRDLSTFKVDLQTTFRLAARIPESVVLVSESGVRDAVDFGRLRGTADALLIGTSLVRASDPAAALGRWIHPLRPVVKVCGLQEAETARVCVEQGVELLGLNFCPRSPRCLTVEQARALTEVVPEARFVGLFQDASLETIQSVIERLPLDFVQLHGQETSEFCSAVSLPVIKSFGVGESPFDGVLPLFDLPKSESHRVVDLSVFDPPRQPYFLAGGLTPDNVRSALRGWSPFGVDVARGVETEGRKDVQKIISFIQQLLR